MDSYSRIGLFYFIWCLVNLFPTTYSTCGYESCSRVEDEYLNVHLVPHSHDDMGWLKTVDQYYYGANNSIQRASVQYILDSVVDELLKDSNRRFIYVETGFFWRWWTNQAPQKQIIVRSLVSSGRLEFINGGWCMNDEATAHYNEIIDQMSLGLRFLHETFGECGIPRVAWQIDPFGHSREQASIFAQMGFDGLFFGRLDYQDKENREVKKNMEMIWSASPQNLGKSAWLFTGALYNGYNPPDGFCWDINCNDNPIMDDPKLLDYNFDEEVNKFINATKAWAAVYQSNHILMTMGSDFQFMAARTWYKNLDKLIKVVNSDEVRNKYKINLLYSTPSCYLQAVHKAEIPLEVKRDDFFPYASSSHSFWTGYFTSRPALKFFIHQTNNFLQICKNFAATKDSGQEMLEKVFQLAEPMAVAQHHDAVSGTAKQHVTFDYAFRLERGIKACEEVIASRMKQLIKRKKMDKMNSYRASLEIAQSPVPENQNLKSEEISFCHQLNISSCTATETMSSFLIHIYNPLGRKIEKTFIRIPVSSDSWKAEDSPGGDVIPIQLIPLAEPVLSIPGRNSSALFDLVIPIDLQPLSIHSIHVSREYPSDIYRQSPNFHSIDSTLPNENGISFTNNKGLGFTLNGETGLLESISRLSASTRTPITLNLSQNFYYYATGMNSSKNDDSDSQVSGAYIFRPNGTIPIPITKSNVAYSIHKGHHVTEIHQKFSDWVSQVIRLYEDSDAIEFEYLVGPIPITDGIGKEIITKYTSDLKTDGIFYTDSNGREILKRERNCRTTWKYKMFEPVAGNYYPVNSRLILTESKQLNWNSGKTLILLNDRAQGGSSINDGEMELMLHRRLLLDDGFGVDEALNETAFGVGLVIRGKHWLVLAGGETGVPTSIHRPMAQQIYRNPILMFQNFNEDVRNVLHRTNEIEGNSIPWNISILESKVIPILPRNIHLLTFEKISQSTCLLRLENFYEKDEDVILSKKAFIRVEELQRAFEFSRIVETTLGGNQWKNESHRMDWTPKPDIKLTQAEINAKVTFFKEGDPVIEFQPMEIKTFLLFY